MIVINWMVSWYGHGGKSHQNHTERTVGRCFCNPKHTQTAFLFTQVAHKPSVCMTPSLHFEWPVPHSCTYSSGMNPWRSWLYGCHAPGWTMLYWQTLTNRRLLKKLSPYSASMHPKPVTDFDMIKLSLAPKGKASLVSGAPPSELRENLALTPPFCSPAKLFSGQCTIQSFLPPLSGYVMTFCYRLIYSKMFENSAFLSVFIELFVT